MLFAIMILPFARITFASRFWVLPFMIIESALSFRSPPLPKLFGTKRLFAEGGNLSRKFGFAQAEEFNLFRHGYFLPHLALMAL